MRHLLFLIFLTAFTASAWGETTAISIADDLLLQTRIPSEKWKVQQEPPRFLLQESVKHLEHEQVGRGGAPSKEELEAVARRRLAVNEAFICNPESEACLVIDFSPLKESEKAPGESAIARSAQYAGAGLEQEEGVTDVGFTTDRIDLHGSQFTYRIDARFRQHQIPRKFIGIVGFSTPYWFYLYYTDLLRDKEDLKEMERILESMSITRQ